MGRHFRSRSSEAEQEQQAKIAEYEEIEKRLELSKIDENHALAQERRARVLSDIGLAKERESEAEQNHAKALLDNARTVKEIADLDRKRLIDVMTLAVDLRKDENQRAEAALDRDLQLSQKLASQGEK